MGLARRVGKGPFHPAYSSKDLLDLVVIILFLLLVLAFPLGTMERLAFEERNRLVSPVHIVPEWYYLWAYGILRAIPSKPLGVMALVGRLLRLALLPFFRKGVPLLGRYTKRVVILFLLNGMFLGWLGSQPAESPYLDRARAATLLYFGWVAALALKGRLAFALLMAGVVLLFLIGLGGPFPERSPSFEVREPPYESTPLASSEGTSS